MELVFQDSKLVATSVILMDRYDNDKTDQHISELRN